MTATTTYHPVLDTLAKAFQRLLWVLIALTISFVFLWFGRRASLVPPGLDGTMPPEYHWWLKVPSCMLTLIVGLITTRTILRIVSMAAPEKLRTFGWYHPAAAVRDLLLLSVLFGLVYYFVTSGLVQMYPGTVVDKVELMDERWWKYRASFLAFFTPVVIFALDRLRLISQGSVAPRGPWSWVAFPLYGASVVGVMYALGDWLTIRFKSPVDPSYLDFVFSLIVSLSIFEVGLLIMIFVLSRDVPRVAFPIQIKLAIVGATEVGKTLYFTQAYTALQDTTELGVKLDAPSTPENRFIINAAKDAIMGQIPPPTPDAQLLSLDLKRYGMTIANYSWLDLKGGAFTDDDAESKAARETFDEYLPKAGGLLLAISAHSANLEVLNMDIYTGRIDAYIQGHLAAGEADAPMSIAVVVTQYKREGAKRLVALTKARELAHYAKECAKVHACGRVVVRVFKTDSWTNPAAKNSVHTPGQRLRSWRVKAPILWLVARSARAQQTAMELAQMTMVGGASRVSQAISVVEQLAREAR